MIEIIFWYLFSVIGAILLSWRCSRIENSSKSSAALKDKINIKGTIALMSFLLLIFFILSDSGYQNTQSDYRQLLGVYNNRDIGFDFLYKIITNNFVHADKNHLVENLMLLAVCAIYENRVGAVRFFIVFGLGGVISSLSVLFIPHEIISSVGASGGIFGLLAALLLDGKISYVRKARSFQMKGKGHLCLAIALLVTSYFIIELDSKGNVNHIAHLLGAVAGTLFVLLTAKLVPPATLYQQLRIKKETPL